MSFVPTASSVAPNDKGKFCWTEERERVLIAFYSEHRCLWDRTSVDHKNRQLRLRLLEVLSNRLSNAPGTVSVDDIKCKFKNLRTVFHREYKSVQSSRTSGELRQPKWKHFQQLLFLYESCDQDESPEDDLAPRLREDGDEEPGGLPRNGASSYARPDRSSRSSAPSDDASSQHLLSENKPSRPTPGRARAARPHPSGPGSGRSYGGRCCWSDTKVQQLVAFYSEHSCLWNHRSESYRNRLLKQSLLEMLSRLLSEGEAVPFTVADIKTKFRNLRTIFQREHRAVASNQTCSSEDFYLPKWKHYPQLTFLSGDQELPDSRPLPRDESLETSPSPSPPLSLRSSPVSFPSASSPHPDGRGRKRASPDLLRCSEALNLMRASCQSHTPSPHAGFLKYVEECLNETPPGEVKKLKKKIIEMIHSVSEEV